MTSLGFTDAWFALGVVDKCSLDEILSERNDDPECEGDVKIRAFFRYLERNRPLSAAACASLFELAVAETSAIVRGALCGRLLRLPETPLEVVHAAMTSEFPFLSNLASFRLRQQGAK